MSYSLKFPYCQLYESRNNITVPVTLLSNPVQWKFSREFNGGSEESS